MYGTEKIIDKFFTAYEANFEKALAGHIDAKATANAFADCFIAANPAGVTCAKNHRQFLKNILQGYTFYRSIGTRSMKILSLMTTVLDDFHLMSKVHWKASYETEKRKAEMEFDVIYFLQFIKEEAKIFAYITGDEQKALKEKGLI